jgi:hypothetical protein
MTKPTIKKSKLPKLNTPTWSEDKIQMYITTMALRDGYLFHADGNGANKGRAGGNKMKLMGSRAGWPDMCFILDGRIVWIELKAANGRVSDAQELVHGRMKGMGCEVYVVKAVDGKSAWSEICHILNR